LIAFLRGKVQGKTDRCVVLDVNGIGYELFLSTNSLSKVPAIGETASLYTYLHVRDDALQLYGFTTPCERELFEYLLSVTGVGPKVALAILSAFSVNSLKEAIVREDVELISAIPGIGKKSAQRLILELKGRLSLPEVATLSQERGKSSTYAQARKALMALGYSAAEAKNALEGFPHDKGEISTEELLKYALRNLASNQR